MDDEKHANGLIDDFFDGGRIEIEELNEIAASLADPLFGMTIWRRLLKKSEDLTDPAKREALGIAVFELLAEPPVHELWLKALPELLASPKLYWVVCRAYLNDRAALADHLELLRDELEGEGIER